jgi:hypothetical protein
MLIFKWMRQVNMECGSLLPLLRQERLAESKAAASRRTPKRPGFQAEKTAIGGGSALSRGFLELAPARPACYIDHSAIDRNLCD